MTAHRYRSGHQDAWEKAGILHRDVSVANILIDISSTPGDSKGFINDWDLCKYKEELNTRTSPSQPGVSVSPVVCRWCRCTHPLCLCSGYLGIWIGSVTDVPKET